MLREQNLFEDLGALPVFAPEKAVAFGVESHGDKVFGRILIPAEVNEGDRSPVVLLLHGYPGLERNMDIPYAFRRAGIAAAYFSYRGVWGSKGTYNFSHLIEDTETMLDYLRENAERFRIDPERIYLFGHSMGGFATLNAIARGAKVRGAVVLAPCDMGMRCIDEPELFENMMLTPKSGYFNLASESDIADDMRAHAQERRFTALADKIPQDMPLYFIGGEKDTTVPPAQHIMPLLDLLKARGMNVSYTSVSDGHAFTAHRIWLIRTVFKYIEEMER